MSGRLALLLAAAGCGALVADEPARIATAADRAPTCANGWRYRAPITVENRTGRKLLDHQLGLVLDTASLIADGKLDATGRDLRFALADGETVVPHVVERDLGTTGTEVWFSLPFIPTGTSQALLFYGAPSAEPIADPSAVFVPGIVANPSFETAGVWSVTAPPGEVSRWTASWPSVGVATDGRHVLAVDLEQDAVSLVPLVMSVGQDIVVPPGDDLILRFDIRVIAASGQGHLAHFRWTAGSAREPIWSLAGGAGNITGGRIGVESAPIAPGATRLAFVVGIDDLSGYAKAELDNVRLRRHATPAPTVTVGPEEPNCP